MFKIFCHHDSTHTNRQTLTSPARFTLYVCLQGGIKAVIWTDALQAVVMLVGLLAVIVVVSLICSQEISAAIWQLLQHLCCNIYALVVYAM